MMKTLKELEREIESYEAYKVLSDDDKDRTKLAYLFFGNEEFRKALTDDCFERTYKPNN